MSIADRSKAEIIEALKTERAQYGLLVLERDALRLSVAALTEEREQVLDVLKSSDERARIAEGERDALARGKRLAECDRESHYGALNNAIRVLMEEFFILSPQGDLPNVNSAGGQLAQCVESVLSEYRARLADLTEERDRLKKEASMQADCYISLLGELESRTSEEAGDEHPALSASRVVPERLKIRGLLIENKRARRAAAWAYQYFGSHDAPVWILDNFCALAQGEVTPHKWKYPADYEARLAAQPEGVPPIQRIIELLRSEIPDRQLSVNHGDEIQGYADGLEEAISILESFTDADLILPPDPVPEEATKPTRLGRIGTTVLDFESEIEYIKQLDAKPGEAPGQFTDRDRECFRAGLMHGCRNGYTLESEQSTAMLAAGLRPSPVAEREKVTLNELVNAYQRGYRQVASTDTNRSAQESGLRAALDAARDKEVVE